MECKSIQSISSSSSRRSYDVFVSFRGEDTRNNFTDHLFAAFRRKGIVAFRDDRNLKQGEHISTELIQAIEGSRVLVVVFSKNYANSSWCLQELAKILECMKVTGQRVLPVFYDVSPSEVRKQKGEYGKAFAEHEERFKQDLGMVQTWREALKEVADLSGWDVQNKPEHGEIEKIVKRVKSILGCKLSSLDGLVGIYSRVEQLEKLLAFESNDDVRVVGICGMGGIGKTTLARAVYDIYFHQFGGCCFIDDMSKVYHKDGPIAAQKQLICQTLKENQEICSISQANYLIRTRLRYLKTLIVLDNVDGVEQLGKLGLNRDGLCVGSRVIVISRNLHILNEYGMDAIYYAQLLNMDEAHQLFCRKAFKHDYIMSSDDISREYKELIDVALKYAQCLPLAIEVLGSLLCGRSISEWRSALARLKDNPNKEIMNVLQISFDGLELEEKEIFLDIACFFEGRNKKYVKRALDCCGFHTDIGIRVLIDKSLITISDSRIKMHHKLQELGMKIVRQDEQWKWSRMWCWEDFDHIMSKKMATDNLKAIKLTFQPGEVKQTTSRVEVLSKMNQLRLLILSHESANSLEDLNCLSNELRFLDWYGYPFTYFRASCETSKLVGLSLCGSRIKQLWDGTKALYNLKIMNLRHSESLVNIPDLSLAPNLEWLNLKGCTKLVHIHPSIGLLRKLAYLNLKNCTSLQSLPNTIFGVRSLETIKLQGCSKLFQSTSDTAIQCQSTFSAVKRLKLMLPLHFFSFRRHNDKVGSMTPSDLARFNMLRKLDLSYCNLVNIPEAIASLYCLEVLNLAGNNFVKPPCIIKELPRLISLNLDNCRQLEELARTDLPIPKELVYWKNKKSRAWLHIFNCPKLDGMEGWGSIAISWMIQFLKVHKETSSAITAVIPGTRIPSWFSCQSVGHRMKIELFPYVHDCNWIGLAICAASVTPCLQDNWTTQICCQLSVGHYWRDVAKTYEVPVGSPIHHLCLFYLSRQELIDIIERGGAHHPAYFSFRKSVQAVVAPGQTVYFLPPDKMHPEVKHCGMRNVFKQDLEEHNGGEC